MMNKNKLLPTALMAGTALFGMGKAAGAAPENAAKAQAPAPVEASGPQVISPSEAATVPQSVQAPEAPVNTDSNQSAEAPDVPVSITPGETVTPVDGNTDSTTTSTEAPTSTTEAPTTSTTQPEKPTTTTNPDEGNDPSNPNKPGGPPTYVDDGGKNEGGVVYGTEPGITIPASPSTVEIGDATSEHLPFTGGDSLPLAVGGLVLAGTGLAAVGGANRHKSPEVVPGVEASTEQ